MYEIIISEKELDTICIALKDSEERLSQQTSKLSCSFFDLPNDLKLFWRDKEAYKKYTDDTAKKCFREMDNIYALQEKLKKYKKKEEEKGEF